MFQMNDFKSISVNTSHAAIQHRRVAAAIERALGEDALMNCSTPENGPPEGRATFRKTDRDSKRMKWIKTNRKLKKIN